MEPEDLLQTALIVSLREQLGEKQAEIEMYQQKGTLSHGMNCPSNVLGEEDVCTCGLGWRSILQTEQTMHAAWRKRAEEAERQLAASQREVEQLKKDPLCQALTDPDCCCHSCLKDAAIGKWIEFEDKSKALQAALDEANEKLEAERIRQLMKDVVFKHVNEKLDEAKGLLKKAADAGEYVVRLVEDTGACGDSPSPNLKADWLGTAMHCYAAMAFLSEVRAFLAAQGGGK